VFFNLGPTLDHRIRISGHVTKVRKWQRVIEQACSLIVEHGCPDGGTPNCLDTRGVYG
jgi:hypothetical protein